MIESLNEEMEIKLSSLRFFCSSYQSLTAANWKESGMCALWGPLTECDCQNWCHMWRMRAAVDISDREEWGLRGFYKWATTSGSCDGYTEITSLQRSLECSDVSYKEHWWQIWWPNGKEHLAAREHPYLTIYKLCLRNLAWAGWSSESGLFWQLGWKRSDPGMCVLWGPLTGIMLLYLIN